MSDYDGMDYEELLSEAEWMSDFLSMMAERITKDPDVHNLVDYVRKLEDETDSLHGRIAFLEEENAKLRELVQDVWRFTGAACKKYPRLFDPSSQGGQMVQLNMIDSFEQRIRELGVEV